MGAKVMNIKKVLILVLMEDTLRDDSQNYDSMEELFVLILVLMEDTLRAIDYPILVFIALGS